MGVRVGVCVLRLHVLVFVPPTLHSLLPLFVFLHVLSHICFFVLFSFLYSFMCVCGHTADLHVGEPQPGVRGEEGGASPLTAARASGRGQCGICRPSDGGDIHLPLATGALWVSVWSTCVVQHRG